MENACELISSILKTQYDLGDVIKVEAIKEGDTNNSFFAYATQNGSEHKWYVRQYNTGESEPELIYEHAFDKFFAERHGDVIDSPVPISNKTGSTWVRAELNGVFNYYAVFNVIKGREPYSWEFNDLTPAAFDGCATATAQFQAWAYGFKGPEGSGCQQEPLMELYKNWREDLKHCFDQKTDPMFRRFNEYFAKEMPFFLKTIDFLEAETAKYESKVPMCVNHGDMNPGNVMFDDSDRVCCIFDLDWVADNMRLYDVCWMGYQLMASWDVHAWGDVPLDNIKRFINVYNKTMIDMKCPMGPLTEDEIKFLPTMMMIGIAKVIMDFSCYEDHRGDEYRVFVNTWRFMESLHYIQDHYDEVLEAAKE